MFELLKLTHISMVVLTITLFVVRARWAFQRSPNLARPLVRWLPHAVDTALLGSALATAAMLGQFPFLNDWLTAKFFALLAYIVLGHITLWRVRNNLERTVAFIATLAVFAYIVMVARCHDPLACLA